MAQQLATEHSPAAYAGVAAYAHAHKGEAASAAYMALGNAYLADQRFGDAVANFEKSREEGSTLADYAVYLEAQADLQQSKPEAALKLIESFDATYPESIFRSRLPLLRAKIYLAAKNPQAAVEALRGYSPGSGRLDYLMTLAKAEQGAGRNTEAARLYREVYLEYPLHPEAKDSKAQMDALGAPALTVEELRKHADALFAGGRYADAAGEYRALASMTSEGSKRDWFLVAAAACERKMNHLTEAQAQALPDTQEESGARRLYLLVELARDRSDAGAQTAIVDEMTRRFPKSRWLATALYSSGNMYLLLKDYPSAIRYYEDLAKRFPRDPYAAKCHWRAAWLNYQIGNYTEAARLMDEQVALYPDGPEVAGALYWRGRIYQDQDHKPETAAAYFDSIAQAFRHYYYAVAARVRLAKMPAVQPAQLMRLKGIHTLSFPELTDDVPEDDEHVIKAHLLANAGLNGYIPAEIQAAPDSSRWGAFAEAKIYASYGEAFRAMAVLKSAIPFYPSAPLDAIPMSYWKILYPLPYWDTIQQSAAQYGLDPYMVAALIRQESEFNPEAISRAHAMGLMQLLPSVGRSMARQVGMRHFSTEDLLKPEINIRLGTRYLSQILSQFDGQPEYAFAAYNAGGNRVTDWRAAWKYDGMDEFIESIPFTETRNYVQAIVRNEAMYRLLHQKQPALQHAQAGGAEPGSASAVAAR